MKKSESRKLSQAQCPECGQRGLLKKIVYGLPSDDFDFEKYAVGGCIIEENAPDVECKGCARRMNLFKD